MIWEIGLVLDTPIKVHDSGFLPTSKSENQKYSNWTFRILTFFHLLINSGGIQEETTALGIPCLTLRDNTERPITVEKGTNKIIGNEESKIVEEFNEIINGKINSHEIPELWDYQLNYLILPKLKQLYWINRVILYQTDFPNLLIFSEQLRTCRFRKWWYGHQTKNER